jgi:hypothetical protein
VFKLPVVAQVPELPARAWHGYARYQSEGEQYHYQECTNCSKPSYGCVNHRTLLKMLWGVEFGAGESVKARAVVLTSRH